MKNHYNELSQMTLSRVNYSQIGTMEEDELREAIGGITLDLLLVSNVGADDSGDPLAIDADFFIKRYFTRYPSKRIERLLCRWRELTNHYWLEDFFM